MTTANRTARRGAVLVPGGEFRMGSDRFYPEEGPVRTVAVPDLWVDEHVRWDLPDELILAAGLGPAYNPRAFRVYYGGNRYNRSAATTPEASHAA